MHISSNPKAESEHRTVVHLEPTGAYDREFWRVAGQVREVDEHGFWQVMQAIQEMQAQAWYWATAPLRALTRPFSPKACQTQSPPPTVDPLSCFTAKGYTGLRPTGVIPARPGHRPNTTLVLAMTREDNPDETVEGHLTYVSRENRFELTIPA